MNAIWDLYIGRIDKFKVDIIVDITVFNCVPQNMPACLPRLEQITHAVKTAIARFPSYLPDILTDGLHSFSTRRALHPTFDNISE